MSGMGDEAATRADEPANAASADEEIDADMAEKMRKYPEDFMLERPPRRLFAYDWSHGYVSPFRETDMTIVDAVLETLRGELREDSLVYDLGCGNGVFLIHAAQRYGCKGVGYDLDETLLETARRASKTHPSSSANRLQFLPRDLFTVDLSAPHVIYLHLLPDVLQRLRPRLEAQLRNRRVVVVSNTWPIEGLEGPIEGLEGPIQGLEGPIQGLEGVVMTEGRAGKQGVFYVYRNSSE